MNESVETIDVAVKDVHGNEEVGKIVITEFRPEGAGPFPIVIMNHGRSSASRSEPPRFRHPRQAQYFVDHGFAVFEPTRIGYGEYATTFDPESSGSCRGKHYGAVAEAGSAEILAVLNHIKSFSFVDPQKILLVGQSVGGYLTMAAAARHPSGLIGAINFAGGHGGNMNKHTGTPCSPQKLENMFERFGRSTTVPTLWIYTENDPLFGPRYSRAWYDTFTASGGMAEYHLLPPFDHNGHALFARGMAKWTPIVDAFLSRLGVAN
ncbi:alpha/beta hydrolase family protein [Herbaspirillum huttiense]|uniref:alpha/beta hydrolase family protein n=1 Tax=Herbaspirillum huttiense TaxID=863372 RepID=UPI002176AE26|nr:prolyl oligopeptidase family serine peptidase [Herbaspirillum huttiense]UWE18089.1 prolyl oligopeptidase family serine peptidase [Herbaspirillum huttiense]